MKKSFKKLMLMLTALLLFIPSAAIVSAQEVKNAGEPIRLGTMNDEEGYILGSMIQLMLEHHGYEVDPKVGQLVNNTSLMRSGIMEDQLDISLDYTGRGLMFIDGVDATLYQKDVETAYETTRKADEENEILWLTYAPAVNTDSLSVTRAFSEEHGLKSLEDLANYINDGGEVKLAIQSGYEYYTTAPTTLPGWQEAYGFEIPASNIVTGIADAKTALAQGTDGINVAGTNTTNGLAKALDLVILKDPKHVAPIYSPAPIASKAIIEKYPELETLFNKMFESLDEETLIGLNAQFEEHGLSEMDIARKYLEENNFFE